MTRFTNKTILLSIIFFLTSIPGVTGTISCRQHALPVIEKAPERPPIVYARISPRNLSGTAARPTAGNPAAAAVPPPTQKHATHHRLSQSYNAIIHKAAAEFEIDPALLKAVIMAESRYNPKAVSKRGARGLMQLMPATAKSLGVADIFDPEDNIYGGALYLKTLIEKFNGDVRLALAAYNAGSRHVKKYAGVPPFKQTRLYIHKVFKYRQLFKEDA